MKLLVCPIVYSKYTCIYSCLVFVVKYNMFKFSDNILVNLEFTTANLYLVHHYIYIYKSRDPQFSKNVQDFRIFKVLRLQRSLPYFTKI